MKKVKVSVFVLLLIIAITAGVYAAPLKDMEKTLTQPDGANVKCLASGDEYFNFLHDINGNIIVKDENTGFYVYAKLEENKFVSTGLIYGRDKCDESIVANKTDITNAVIDNYIGDKMYRRNDSRRLNAMIGSSEKKITEGTINNISIFIRFNDESEFQASKSYYDGIFNGSGINDKSLYSYYKEISYNKLEVATSFYPQSSNNIASYKDINPRAYYEKYNRITNPIGYRTEDESYIREEELLERAINAVKYEIPANIDIDNNDDGEVDNICFIVKGEPGEWADLLWPHQSSFQIKDIYINNSKAGTFNFQLEAELEAENSYRVLSHEMFHTMGAPDLYHYSYDDFDCVGPWDLMESGGGHMSAYMKYRYGKWISQIPTINSSGVYSLSPLTENTNNCYRIAAPNSSDEYFVVEYRKNTDQFEAGLPGEGLLVYRINGLYNGKGNADGPPDEVYLFRLDGKIDQNGDVKNANLCKEAGRTSAGAESGSDINMYLSDGRIGGIVIDNIGSCGDKISFTVKTKGSDQPLTLSEHSIAMTKGTSKQLTVQGDSSGLVWSSTDTSVAEVSSSGIVTSKNPGRSTIKVAASDGLKSDSCEVLVDMSVFKNYDAKTTADASKTWTVKLNKKVSQEGLKDNVYITDDGNNRIETSVEITSDGYSIVVSPVNTYAYDKTYTLWIKNIKGASMEALKQWIKMDFSLNY